MSGEHGYTRKGIRMDILIRYSDTWGITFISKPKVVHINLDQNLVLCDTCIATKLVDESFETEF